MSVRSAQSITVEFTTASFSTGAATDADSTPTGTLVVNGTDNGATVTVTNVDTGRYKAVVTLPTLAIGDVVELLIAATVGGVSGKAIVWRDTADLSLSSTGSVRLADGVAHGGSTATLRLGSSSSTPALHVTNSSGRGVVVDSAGGTGHAVELAGNASGAGLRVTGAGASGIEVRVSGAGNAIRFVSTGSGELISGVVAAGTYFSTGYIDEIQDGLSTLTSADVLAAGDIDGYSLEETLKLCLAALAGKLSGATTTTVTIRAADDSKTRITATVDADGNRTAITHDVTG